MNPDRKAATLEVPDDSEAVFEYAIEHGWSDGLPIIPPTPERVARMMASVARSPDEVVSLLNPRQGSLARGRDLQLPAGARDEEQRAFLELRGVGQRVFAQDGLQRHVVGARDPPQRLSGADVVHHAALLVGAQRGRLRDRRRAAVGAGAGERRKDDQSERLSPGRSHCFSSSTSACCVRSRCSGVTEMNRRSNTASQSLPGTFSCACSSPPIQ